MRLILPKLLKFFPFAFEVLALVASIFTSDAARRIVDFVIQALPIIVEFLGTLLCTLVIYLGSASCYIVYALAITMSFVLRYIVRPVVCGGLAVLAGCFEPFVMSAIDGNSCYTCGKYNTGCGCRANTYPLGGCGGTCTDTSTPSQPVQFPAGTPTAAPAPPPVTERSRNYAAKTDFMDTVVTNDATYTDEGLETTHSIVEDEFPLNQLPDYTPESSSAFGDSNVGREPVTASGPSPPTQSPTAAPTPAPIVQLATPEYSVVYGTPGLYAEVTTTESFDSYGEITTGVRLGSLPFYDHETNGTQCSTGASLSSTACGSAGVWTALAATVESEGVTGVFDRHNAATAWQPADRVPLLQPASAQPGIWLRLDFKQACRVAQVTSKWTSNDAALQAPMQSKYELLLHGQTGPVLSETHSHSCFQTFSRTDTWSPHSTVPVTSLLLVPISPCSGAASGANPGALYALSSISVTGSVVADTVQPQWTPLQNPRISVGELTGGSHGVEIWSACNRRNAESLTDGKRGFASAPIVLSRSAASTSQAAPIAVSATFANGDRYAALNRLVLHLRGPNALSRALLLACPVNTTQHTENDPPGSLWTDPPVGTAAAHCATASVQSDPIHLQSSRKTAFQSELASAQTANTLDIPSWWLNSTGFYTDPYYALIKGEQGRDTSYVFEFDSCPPAQAFTLWLTSDAHLGHSANDPFKSARSTTWHTALLELGLDPLTTQTAQWRLAPANGAACNEHDYTATVDSALYPSELTPDTTVFGSASAARPWVALEEIDVWVTPIYIPNSTNLNGSNHSTNTNSYQSQSAARRLLAAEGDQRPDASAEFDAARRALAGEKFSWERTQEKTSLADVMDSYRDTGNPFRPSAAPETGGSQPYSDDLSLMPDPATEPQFDCQVYHLEGNGSTNRMRCFGSTRPMLGSPTATSQEGPAPDTSPNGAHSKEMESISAISAISATLQSRNLQLQLDELVSLRAQQTLLRDVALRRITQQHNVAAAAQAPTPAPTFPRVEETQKPLRQSSSRRLFGSGPWDEFKDWVEGFVEDALDAFEGLICDAMMCGSYCTPERGCTDSGDIGQCFDAFQQWLLEEISKPIRDMFKWLLRKLLWMVDRMGSMVGKMTGIGDMLKNVACVGCSLTGIAVGVVADFVDDFSISTCASIVDKGGDQCSEWGLGLDDFGGKVFGNFFPLMKIGFGMVQVLPAFLEVCIEVATLIFSDLLAVFPEMLGDAFDVLLFFISSSEAVAVMEVLFEAFDPISDASDDIANVKSNMRGAAAQPADQHPDVHSDLQHTVSPSGMVCNRPGEYTQGGACGATYSHTNNSAMRDELIARSDEIVTSDSDLAFSLDGSCGCAVERPSCADGPNAGNCAFKEGTHTLRVRDRAARLEQQAQNAEDDCANWPQCAGIQSKTVGVVGSDKAARSGEVERRCVASKKCKIDSIAERNNAFPFGCFSRNEDANGTAVFWKKGEECPSALKFQEILDEPAVHRRRRATTASTSAHVQRRLARRLMGMDGIFEDTEEEHDGSQRESNDELSRQLQVAVKGFETMVAAGNKSYAYYQVQAIRSDIENLGKFYNANKATVLAAARNLTISTRVAETVEYTQTVLAHSRRLLFGFSGVEVEDIGCGWIDIEDYMPNTYPVTHSQYS